MSASANSNQTIDSTGETIFDQSVDGGKCTGFLVGVRSSSSFPVLVNIPGLHKTGEFFSIPIGVSQIFENKGEGHASQNILTVVAKGDGGDTILDWGVVSKQRIVR